MLEWVIFLVYLVSLLSIYLVKLIIYLSKVDYIKDLSVLFIHSFKLSFVKEKNDIIVHLIFLSREILTHILCKLVKVILVPLKSNVLVVAERLIKKSYVRVPTYIVKSEYYYLTCKSEGYCLAYKNRSSYLVYQKWRL